MSRQTVKNILKEHGLDPGPQRGQGSWDEFLRIHASTLWSCEFLSNKTWTLGGLLDMYLLIFIHLGTRRVLISSATAHPNSAWVAQQARNFCMEFGGTELHPTIVMHDSDTKFTSQFDAILQSEGIQAKKLTPESPNLNAYVERFVQTLPQEALDHFVVLGERHLNYLVREFVAHYHAERCHQGVGNLPPVIGETAGRVRVGRGDRAPRAAGRTVEGLRAAGGVSASESARPCGSGRPNRRKL